jgi:catechol 2,3-dioxygenase-like lactoylglutathione lyase family enzyme
LTVLALDHVNIVVADMAATIGFYTSLFGLEPRDPPAPLPAEHVQWLHDSQGRAIVHLVSPAMPRDWERDMQPGPTGALHHVALLCDDIDGFRERLKARAIVFRENHAQQTGLRQIFLTDPNDVLLELNFPPC